MIPTGRTLYTFAAQYPSLIVRGGACAVRLPAYRAGALVAPTSGTYSLIAPGGAVIVNVAAVTVASSIATYTIPALSLPNGLSEGLPSSLQLIGPAHSENLLLRLGAAFEAEHAFDPVPPSMRSGA